MSPTITMPTDAPLFLVLRRDDPCGGVRTTTALPRIFLTIRAAEAAIAADGALIPVGNYQDGGEDRAWARTGEDGDSCTWTIVEATMAL